MHRELFVTFTLLSTICGQDPADGWLGYAQATYPKGIITYIEAKWRVPDDPNEGGAFFSPWFGIEASDNLNLIQPVNPWVGKLSMCFLTYLVIPPNGSFYFVP